MNFDPDLEHWSSKADPFTCFKGKPVEREEAVSVLLKIEAVVSKLGAHTALTGSCIYKGKSADDIDIIIYPHQTDNPPTKDEILHALRATGHLGKVNEAGVWYIQTDKQYLDKDVVIINFDGFRVDLLLFLHIA